MAPRPLLVGAGLVLLVVLAVPGEGGASRLRGSVACLDCAPGHSLSGVVVAVRCAGDGGGRGGGAGLHAVRTDARGAFDVAMPSSASGTAPCAARVIGATTEQLCAPRGLAVARVVPVGRAPASSSYYALGSRLAFFTTRCRRPTSGGGGAAVAIATTTDAHDQQRQQGDAAPRVPAARPMPPAMPTPPVVSAPPRDSPPIGVGGGLPLIYFFPFIPIIGIP